MGRCEVNPLAVARPPRTCVGGLRLTRRDEDGWVYSRAILARWGGFGRLENRWRFENRNADWRVGSVQECTPHGVAGLARRPPERIAHATRRALPGRFTRMAPRRVQWEWENTP